METIQHYDQSYFDWQKTRGEFGGQAELIKFESLVADTDNVVDFGCGGGYLLARLRCKGKLGVEINPVARQNCVALNVPAVETIDEIPSGWADKIISNHALEHVSNPFETIAALKSKLKPDGRLIFVVPCERVDTRFMEGNVDQHLYTWSPINLGNLFTAAGYEVVECKAFLHRWMPRFLVAQRVLGWKLFHVGSWVYGRLFQRLSQVRIIAKIKPA